MSETTEQEAVELSINDLHSLRAIIDVASSRGAFKPGEMMAIGTTYNKLATFLDNVQKSSTTTEGTTNG